MTYTPRVDREVYTVTEKDIGFQVVGVELAKILERKVIILESALRSIRSDSRAPEYISDWADSAIKQSYKVPK